MEIAMHSGAKADGYFHFYTDSRKVNSFIVPDALLIIVLTILRRQNISPS